MINNKKIIIVMPTYNAELTLRKTYNEIPFDIVDDVIVTDDYSSDETLKVAKQLGIEHILIHSKTGWTNQIGWNVGYIETRYNNWIFAMNQDVFAKQEAKYRKKITYEILKLENIID